MKIKQANIVSREDIEGLVKTLEDCIQGLLENRERNTLYTLCRLRDNIEMNLAEVTETEPRIHQKVRIVNADDWEVQEYVGQEGWIVNIDKNWQYPFEVEFEDKELGENWLWRADNLLII